MLTEFIISAVLSFVVTAVLGRLLIPALKSVKMGQKILDIGPRWHKSKEGTPTMGGLFFISGILICTMTLGVYEASKHEGELGMLLVSLGFMLLCGLTGFIDDYVKFFKKQNKGLTPNQKMILQLFSAALYLVGLNAVGRLSTVLRFPFTDFCIDFGVFFYPLAILGIVFFVNAVNLTDGIDGLAASVTLMVAIFFSVAAHRFFAAYADATMLVLCGAVIGGMLGFLVYNFHPARVFMGDTGSLFLGGTVVCLAFWLELPLILVGVGIIYIAEAVSVIIQVTVYKLTKKRVFKMTPIHHHFEMCGWGEIKIVTVFSLITAAASALVLYGYLA